MRFTVARLIEEGLLCALPYTEEEREQGSPSKVCGPTDKGVRRARELGFETEATKAFDEHSGRTVDHELEISHFILAIMHFAETRGLIPKFYRRRLKRGSIYPDLLFSLEDPKLPNGDNKLFFFVEVERAKFAKYDNGIPSIVPRLGDYYDLFNTDEAKRIWGFRKFRVIVVQRNDHKRATLLGHLESKYSHRMFWLTTEPAYRDDIGGEIFLTPKDHEHSRYSLNGV